VLTSCPECLYALKKVYPSLGFPINAGIYHVSEYIGSLVKDGNLALKRSFDRTITYHDPCYLGRHAKVFDAPRQVIKNIRGIDFVEMRWIKDKAYCCGGNEGFAIIHPELSATIGGKVIEEAEKAGGEALVTACPLCKELLTKHATDKNIELYDLAELVEQLL